MECPEAKVNDRETLSADLQLGSLNTHSSLTLDLDLPKDFADTGICATGHHHFSCASCIVLASPPYLWGLSGVSDMSKQLQAADNGSAFTGRCTQVLPWAAGTSQVMLCQGPDAANFWSSRWEAASRRGCPVWHGIGESTFSLPSWRREDRGKQRLQKLWVSDQQRSFLNVLRVHFPTCKGKGICA